MLPWPGGKRLKGRQLKRQKTIFFRRSFRSIEKFVNFGLNGGDEAGLKEAATAFSEVFNPDTEHWERL